MYCMTVETLRPADMLGQREATSARRTTTLYDVLAALQTIIPPEDDDLVVAIVAHWLRSGRLTRAADVSASAAGGLAPWP
jgi:hypothetical protein